MSPNSVCNRTHASRSSDFVNHSYDFSLQIVLPVVACLGEDKRQREICLCSQARC